jgi:hypothetical protein
MEKTGEVFFLNENGELFLAKSFQDENNVVKTAHVKIETEEDFTRYPSSKEFLKLKKYGHTIV